jgi:hypothetical protein
MINNAVHGNASIVQEGIWEIEYRASAKITQIL